LKTPISGVHYVSSVVAEGAANPAQIVAAQRKVIASAREHFDVIVLDTAPLLLANDAVQVVGCADSVLLVARFESTTIDRAQRAMELLSRVEAPVAGVVLVATPEESGGYYYYSSQRDAAPSRSAEHDGVTGAPVRGGDGAVPNGLPSDPVDQPDPLG
jgi:Mrp family chromosome partitioning ATPase